MKAVIEQKGTGKNFILRDYAILFLIALGSVTILVLSLNSLSRSYEKNTEQGSASHLLEINHQIQFSIESTISDSRKIADSLKSYIEEDDGESTDQLFQHMAAEKSIWGIQEIYLYTQDGICVDSADAVQADLNATEFAADIIRESNAYNLSKSQLKYGVAVSTGQQLNGSPIVAVSVARDLGSLLDNMEIHSFGGSGAFYLTRQNGVRVSQTHNDYSASTYNVLSLLEVGSLTSLDSSSDAIETSMSAALERIFIYQNGSSRYYVIMTPVQAVPGEVWYLFCMISTSAVNRDIDSFSRSAARISIVDICVILVLFLLFFLYNQRKTRKYNESLQKRDEELSDMLVLADSANKAKTEFLSNVSHDIRTPLNAVINMTAFAQKDIHDPEKLSQYLKIIQVSSNHLLSLINDVLDMSRIESGRLKLTSQVFDLGDDLQSIVGIIRPLCDKKSQTLDCRIDDLQHRWLKGDMLRVNQVLINLLNNASKFTQDGGRIQFSATELPSIKEGTAAFRFTVQDNGIGIREEDQKRIFEPFTRVQDGHAAHVEGTGLGLAITNNIVHAMGGTIALQSEFGKGSRFTVELYFDICSEVPSSNEQTAEDMNLRFEGKRALVVEDNEINRIIADTILESWGFQTDNAEDGDTALKDYLGQAPHYYDVIYMDIQMPGMDGYETAKAIRASGKEDAAEIAIIAMTANVFSDDVEKARAAGMNAHVGKPISPEELHAVTRNALQKAGKTKEEEGR